MNLGFLSALPGIGSALGGIAGLFNKPKNPTNAANSYLDKIPGQTGQYYQPYVNSGQNALKQLQEQYGALLGNPQGMYNKFAEGYKESPGYQFRLKNALQAGQNSSAAGGMLGTPQDQQNAMQTGNDIASQDFNDYISQLSGLYGKGLEGTQGLNTHGYDASSSMGNMLAQILGQKGQNAFTGQQGMNQANQQNWANIFGGASAAGQGYNSYNQQQQLLDWLKQNGGF